LITRREGIRREVEENTVRKTLKPVMFHASALIDLAIEHGEDATRSILFRNVFLKGMAWSKELYKHKQRKCRYPF
jgi:hypothetical protein